jgi:hypothetical protein
VFPVILLTRTVLSQMEKNSYCRPSRKYVQDSVMGYCKRIKKLHLNLWKLPLAVGPLNYLTLHIISTFSNNSWKQNSTVSVSSFYTHRPNVFTLILFSSGGRAGITWVPSNKIIFLSPPSDIKRLSLPTKCFLYTFTFLIFYPTLSLFSA